MKTTVLVALSFSLVACGGSLEVEDGVPMHAEAELREGFVAPPALAKSSQRSARVQVLRGDAAIEAARLAGDSRMEVNPEVIEAARAPQARGEDDVLVLSVSVIETARESLRISASRPVTAETMFELSGVKKLNLSCNAQATGQTTASAHCTWADGRELSATELRALPELLSFVGSLED